MALHAKAKAEAGYRFYAMYDKISREDILAHAYAQCRSNKGAPGVDGQDFADIEAYGVERWLAELRLPRFSGRFVSLQSTSWSWRPACRLRRLSVSGIPGPNATAPDYTNPRCSRSMPSWPRPGMRTCGGRAVRARG